MSKRQAAARQELGRKMGRFHVPLEVGTADPVRGALPSRDDLGVSAGSPCPHCGCTRVVKLVAGDGCRRCGRKRSGAPA